MRRSLAALPAAAVLTLLFAAPTLAQNASLTITNLICPEGYSGSSYAEDCTTVPDPALPFQLDGPVSASAETDASGTVSFTGLEAGSYTVTGGAPGDFAEAVVECSATDGDVSVSQDGAMATIEIAADAEVSCSWWNIPQSAAGEAPDTAMGAGGAPDAPIVPADLLVIAGMVAAVAGVRLTAARVGARARH